MQLLDKNKLNDGNDIKKLELIDSFNPEWIDLYPYIL